MSTDPLRAEPADPPIPPPVPLGREPAPEAVVSRLAGEPGATALWGRWLSPTARRQLLVLRSPGRTVTGREEVLAVLDEEPAVRAEGAVVGGGWVVCLAYQPELSWARHYDHLLRWRQDEGWTLEALPDVAGSNGTSAAGGALQAARELLAAAGDSGAGDYRVGMFRTLADPERARRRYLAAVEEVIGRIDHGAFYQLNLCTRLHASVSGNLAALFADLVRRLDPPYGAWLPAPGTGPDVLSCSPELFLRVRGERVLTAPIKGTAPRTTDRDGAAELRASAKDAAENVMITDLMRNDLSRVCRTGSVRVTGLLQVEAHPGVWHLVSTVAGALPAATTVGALLRATFPPGSVTGAPKSSAVRGIAALEPENRGGYTGAVGLVSPLSGSEWSVLIRSFEATADRRGTPRLALGVGAGITVDSVPVREWRECLDKAAPLVAATGSNMHLDLHRPPPSPPPEVVAAGIFDTILVVGGRPLRLAAHMARLDRSCREVYGASPPDDLPARLRSALSALTDESALPQETAPAVRARSVIRHALTVHAVPSPLGGLAVTVATRTVGARSAAGTLAWHSRPDGCWRHKWRDRRWLERAEDAVAPALPYFTDWRGHVTETSRGNLFALAADGTWVTPPLDEDVLPGVTRRETLDLLVDAGERVRIDALRPADLRAGRPVMWTSSLSGAVAVKSVDGVEAVVAHAVLRRLNERLSGGRR